MSEEEKGTQVLTITQHLEAELKKLTPEEDLKALAEESMDYKVLSATDKESYELVVEQRKRVVKARTGIDKTRKEIKAPALDFGKKVDAKAKELTEIISPAEAHLIEQEKIYTDEQARIEKQKEAERLERIRLRTEQVMQCKPTSTVDGFVIGAHTITRHEIEHMTETDFETRISALVDAANERDEQEAETQAKLARLAELEKQVAEAKKNTDDAVAELQEKADKKAYGAVQSVNEGMRGVPAPNPLMKDEAGGGVLDGVFDDEAIEAAFPFVPEEPQTEVSVELVNDVVSKLLASPSDIDTTVSVLETTNKFGKKVQITIGCVRTEKNFKKVWDGVEAKEKEV